MDEIVVPAFEFNSCNFVPMPWINSLPRLLISERLSIAAQDFDPDSELAIGFGIETSRLGCSKFKMQIPEIVHV